MITRSTHVQKSLKNNAVWSPFVVPTDDCPAVDQRLIVADN